MNRHVRFLRCCCLSVSSSVVVPNKDVEDVSLFWLAGFGFSNGKHSEPDPSSVFNGKRRIFKWSTTTSEGHRWFNIPVLVSVQIRRASKERRRHVSIFAWFWF
jgi:hypothetical protein